MIGECAGRVEGSLGVLVGLDGLIVGLSREMTPASKSLRWRSTSAWLYW